MKITVIGATGGTGSQVVRQALAAGHQVTAVVRNPAGLTVSGSGLQVIVADVRDANALTAAVTGRDAVISALGSRGDGPHTIVGDGTAATLQAMTSAGVRRFVVISASGMVTDAGDGLLIRTVVKPLLGRLLRAGFIDLRRMEEMVTGSDVDWTIVRPPRLTMGRLTGSYRTAVDRNVRRGMSLSRADLAHCALAACTDPATIRHTIGVGY